jgi:hypothetical protein
VIPVALAGYPRALWPAVAHRDRKPRNVDFEAEAVQSATDWSEYASDGREGNRQTSWRYGGQKL